MDILAVVLPIAVGALIGYCTNYIAIKMLFHPRCEVRIGNMKLPFTPGVIPKNRGRIARAVGGAVSERLLTAGDLIEAMKSSSMKEAVTDKLIGGFFNTGLSIKELAAQISGAEPEAMISKAEDVVTGKIVESINKIDFEKLIAETAGAAVAEKLQGTMMAMFISESTISSLAAPIGEYIQRYAAEHGSEIVGPAVSEEINRFAVMTPEEAVQSIGLEDVAGALKRIVGNLYEHLVADVLGSAVNNFDIAALVESKINEMDVKELEDLVMSVMKRELQAIINLGALIGAVIGIVNVFI